MISGRKRRSFFGFRISYDSNEVGLLTSETRTEQVLKSFEYTTFDLLYTEIKKRFITPLIDHNYDTLAYNYQKKVKTEYSNTVNVNQYIKQLDASDRAKINTEMTIFEFYVSEIQRYINLYGDDNMRYSIIADSLNLTQKSYLLFSDFTSTNQFVDRLKGQIETILNDYNDDNVITDASQNEYKAPLNTDTKVSASINQEYIIYIQRYGYPVGGVFDSAKLSDILLELNGN